MAPALSTHEIPIKDLDPAHDGLVVAHITDVHVGLLTPARRIRRAVALANAAAADLVLLTGDYVCYAPKFVPIMGELLDGLHAREGVVATLGNHDHWTDAPGVTWALRRNGYDVLRNRSVTLRPRGVPLTVVGIDDGVTRHDDVSAAFAGVSRRGSVLALTHTPELAPAAVEAGARLVMAGHTHGGHVHVRGWSDRVYRRLTRRRYLAGWYEVGDALLYVNRGLGSSSIPVRAGAGARAEVAVFTLRRAEAA